jgi:hypothetical protein
MLCSRRGRSRWRSIGNNSRKVESVVNDLESPAARRQSRIACPPHIKELRKQSRILYKDFMTTGDQRVWVRYKALEAQLQREERKRRREIDQKEMKELETVQSGNPRRYWQILNSMTKNPKKQKKRTIQKSAIDEKKQETTDPDKIKEIWKKAFIDLGGEDMKDPKFDTEYGLKVEQEVQEILRMERKRKDEERIEETDELNCPIELAEVLNAIQKLSSGKAAGVDGIVTEVLKYGGACMHMLVWRLYQQTFSKETIPIDWARGMIFPIYKNEVGNDVRNPLSYRGITLLSVVGKVYTTILNQRLSNWAEKHNVLAEEQGGFRPGRGCDDQLFVLTEMIKIQKLDKKKVFACFIDVKKAYDRVWRNGLWHKIHRSGVQGKMWRVIYNLYETTQSAVLIGRSLTDWFDINVGVRQGDVLSPILFSLFINGIADDIKKRGLGIKLVARIGDSWIDVATAEIGILLYADDIVLLAESESELQSMMDIVSTMAREWRFEMNDTKSKVMVFRDKNAKRVKKADWLLGGKVISEVDEYKYLGVTLQAN